MGTFRNLEIYFVGILIIAVVNGYEQYIGNARHKDYPEKCYYEETGKVLSFGETYRPTNTENCRKITCRDDYVLRINTCPRYQVGDGCKVISGDLSKPFPRCCPSLACRERNGEVSIRPTHTEYEDINQVYY